jgi:hypothetical protein
MKGRFPCVRIIVFCSAAIGTPDAILPGNSKHLIMSGSEKEDFMPTCFVIQPFDKDKFDKRFEDIFKPAIEAAGLTAYRVDKDYGVEIPIDSIEDGIRSSAICLADITTDNPNVWYELGFALALSKPTIMVCSEERSGNKYPFDIQHRNIIGYQVGSSSDFQRLNNNIQLKIKALMDKGAAIQQLTESEPIASQAGLSQSEILLLAVLAGGLDFPTSSIASHETKKDAERAGLTSVGFQLGLNRLIRKYLVGITTETNENGWDYQALCITESGWAWIDANDSMFVLLRPKEAAGKVATTGYEDDIPF